MTPNTVFVTYSSREIFGVVRMHLIISLFSRLLNEVNHVSVTIVNKNVSYMETKC